MTLVTALAGLLAGIVHVLAGPDHLAAVAPLAADRPRQGWRCGLGWGTGHTGGVLLVGALALLLRGLLPLDALSSWSERLVGVALVAIGLWGLRRALFNRLHAHRHLHDGVEHTHLHFHPPEREHGTRRAHLHSHLSISMGILHGLAGSSHVLGVLPALAMPSWGGSVGYLAAFGLGSIAAMTAFGWLIGLSLERLAGTGLRSYRVFLAGTSLAAIAVGAVWLVL
jgi:ABC-type nickel/cobalt efflux system permease component RcnA